MPKKCNSRCCASRASTRADVNTLSSATNFLVEDSRGELNVSWETLKSVIQSFVLGVAIVPKRVYVSGAYTANGTEDEIYCTGTTTINLPAISDSVKSPWINAEGGTVTITANGADAIQTGYDTVVDGDTVKYGAKVATAQWRAL